MTRAKVDAATPASRLHARLAELGVSLSRLAAEIGVSKALVGQWAAGAAEPKGERLRATAVFLGLSPDWLATGMGAKACEHRELTPVEERLVDLRLRLGVLSAEARAVRAEVRHLEAERAEAQGRARAFRGEP